MGWLAQERSVLYHRRGARMMMREISKIPLLEHDTPSNGGTMKQASPTGTVIAVCQSAEPGMPKPQVDQLHVIADWGVEGDYHAGTLVRHRAMAAEEPTLRNDRQVSLADAAALTELAQQGLPVSPGMFGENITIEGIAVSELPTGTRLAIGSVVLEVTAVCASCYQIGDTASCQLPAEKVRGHLSRKASLMARVLQGGDIRAGDHIKALLPS